MKRRISTGLVLGLALCVVLAGIVWASAAGVGVVSDTSAKVHYAGLIGGSSYPVTPASGLPANWNMPGFDDTAWGWAALYQHSAYLDPTVTPPFDTNGAKWISINPSGAGPDYSTSTGTRGVYLYRKTLGPVPGVAYNVSGQAAIASDNYGWLYLNGTLILSPKDPTQYDRNFLAEVGPSTGSVPPAAVVCGMNVLAAEVQNGISISRNGPTGAVFSVDLNYEVPDVVWQPPVTNADFALKDGTTLPLKFKLYMQDGTLITDMQNVYLMVHGSGLDGGVTWNLGDGIDSLRFDPYEWYYITNFQTRDYTLTEGGIYTAVVHDSCTDETLGSIAFELNAKAGRGNSNK